MRPERLELEGFTAFRRKVEVDFSDLELFAVSGPTGAGKSSLIDGITFALYGQVPRHGAGSVEPVISLGTARARVRFDFSLGGERYTAVRVVTRTSSGGASTNEARLERGDTVLASGAREVTKAVEALFGLGVEHFTRSVVLPQGEFAAFLHDSPGDQQELLTALLDLRVLDTVRGLARERARRAEGVVEANRVRLVDLAGATVEAVAAAGSRVGRLEALADRVGELESDLAEAAKAAEELDGSIAQGRADVEALEGLVVPDGVATLGVSIVDVGSRLEGLTQRRDEARSALEAARGRLESLPGADVLDAWGRQHRQLAQEEERLAVIDLDGSRAGLAQAEAVLESAVAERDLAISAFEAARTRHAAHVLREGLSAGDQCPVCDRTVDAAPTGDRPDDMPQTEAALEASEARVTSAREAKELAAAHHGRLESRADTIREAIAQLRAAVERLPDEAELERLARTRSSALEAVEASVSEMRRADEEVVEATDRLDALRAEERRARERFEEARTAVAHLGPPPSGHEDLARDWQALAAWSQLRGDEVRTSLVEAEEKLQEISEVVEAGKLALAESLASEDVDPQGAATVVAAVAAAQATARSELSRLEERCREREGLEADTIVFEERRQVAGSLAKHLRADGFEAWLLEEAIDALLDGANELLGELSGQAYSLVAGDRVIEVVDHRNADERRSVKSLSGGETFLVSLALALSLGRRLLDMSDRGGEALEAIFLDEGFGTLDAETLDTVASVVSELAAAGRMVGVVTHVRELADQIPVRFRVQTSPLGSTVARSDRPEPLSVSRSGEPV